MVGRLYTHAVVGAFSVQGAAGNSLDLCVLGACGSVCVVLCHGGLQTLGVNAQLLSQLVQGCAFAVVAQTHMLADAVEGIIAGLVGDVVGSTVSLLLHHGAPILAGLVGQQGAFLVGQQVHVSTAGQVTVGHNDVGEEAHLAHLIHLEAVLLEYLHEITGGAHLVGGVEHFVAGGILSQQFLVGAEAAGGDDGAISVDGVGFAGVVGHDHALAHAVFHHQIRALGAGAHFHAQVGGSLLQPGLNHFAGVLVVFRHVVGAAVVVVQLNAHGTEPGIQGVLFVGPHLNPLSRFAVGALGFNKLGQAFLAHPFGVAGGLLCLGVDQVEEVHVELAVAAEDVQLLHQNHVLVRIGLLGADGGCKACRAAAYDHDVAALGGTLGGRLLVIGHLHRGGFQTGLLHGIGHGSLHGIRGESSGGHAVHIRRVGGKNPLTDDRESPIDDHIGLMVVAQGDVGDDTVFDGYVHGHFSVVAIARGGVGLGHSNAACQHGCGGQQTEHLDLMHGCPPFSAEGFIALPAYPEAYYTDTLQQSQQEKKCIFNKKEVHTENSLL